MSLPTRERGLKLSLNHHLTSTQIVAPYTGAWIETLMVRDGLRLAIVAPHTGAWIETLPDQPSP